MPIEQDFHFESAETVRNWRPFLGEGEDYIQEVLEKFKEEFGQLPGIGNIAHGNNHGSTWVISYDHPFIFDHREVPPLVYLGVDTKGGTPLTEMPREFWVSNETDENGKPKEYVWAPERYEAFVDRCTDEIRQKLGNPNMSRKDMLDALSPVPEGFEAWKAQCRVWEDKGTIPKYQTPT